jgi:hypothetical protein
VEPETLFCCIRAKELSHYSYGEGKKGKWIYYPILLYMIARAYRGALRGSAQALFSGKDMSQKFYSTDNKYGLFTMKYE